MREIKFRAWDSERIQMIPWVDILGFSVRGTFVDHGLVPMQYTGLKDRNGVEIYEGDILKGYNGGYLHVIQYFQPDCRYIAIHKEDYDTGKWDDKDEAFGLVWVECEVVGNIYESKEE